MELVIVTLKSGSKYEMKPEHLKIYPAGDIEYQHATHSDFHGVLQGTNKRGMVQKDFIKSTAFY